MTFKAEEDLVLRQILHIWRTEGKKVAGVVQVPANSAKVQWPTMSPFTQTED